MNKFTSIATGILIFGGSLFAQDKDKKEPVLPKEVQTILKDRDVAMEEITVKYQKESDRLIDVAVKKLETVMTEKTKKGDLEGALAAKSEMDRLKGEKTEKYENGKGGEKELKKMIVGKWKCNNGLVVFKEDNTWTSPWGDFFGTWEYTEKILIMICTGTNKQDITVKINKNFKTMNISTVQGTVLDITKE